jgi:hypothetical protein
MLRLVLVGAKSYEGYMKVLPWDIAGHRDPLGVLILGRSISPLIHVCLEKPRSLLAATQRIDEDRIVTRSI